MSYLIKYDYRNQSTMNQHDYRKNWIKNIKQCVQIKHANVNVSLIEENVFQINGEITINVGVSVKNGMYVKKIIFGIRILVHVFVKRENI